MRHWRTGPHDIIRRQDMFGIGMPEMVVVLVIILIVFGAGKLPEIGGGIGKAIKNFKKATHEDHPDQGKIEDKADKTSKE